MPCRDFFAFCTSLQPLELKALGALSEARHVDSGITICEPGQATDTLYIVNRGTLEIVRPSGTTSDVNNYLARGDLFGDIGALIGQVCEFEIRTCEPVSLRCFRRENFPELIKRVPSFFLFLAEQLANRLFHAREVSVAQPACLELSGSLKNFDLVTIYQTIVNSSQTGELSIRDEWGELISSFFFDAGEPRGAQFQHLVGEEAFWQLFLANDLQGTFSFASGDHAVSHTIRGGSIVRSAGDMLINALQGRDEFNSLKLSMPGATTFLERLKQKLEPTQTASPEIRAIMEQIWFLPFEGVTPLRALYPQLAVCELKIYRAVQELLRAKQLTLAPAMLPQKVA